jgi:hypothetical protein
MSNHRQLTHDEKKASEAAFQGLPFNPEWSNSAKAVYEGIAQALGHTNFEPPEQIPDNQATESSSPPEETAEPTDSPSPLQSEQTNNPTILSLTKDSPLLHSRKEAIHAGILRDATPAAKRIGLHLPVGLTNALWEEYVAIDKDMTDEHIQSRLQDIMVGVRLRLASLKDGVPFIDVPILLNFPPEPIPQVSLTFALFHRDPDEGHCLLLIHPGEIFSSRQNIAQN